MGEILDSGDVLNNWQADELIPYPEGFGEWCVDDRMRWTAWAMGTKDEDEPKPQWRRIDE